jgi:hypothetical protein
MSRLLLWVGAVFAATAGFARGAEPVAPVSPDEPVVPASGHHRSAVAPLYCPPAVPGYPVYPGCPPVVPGTPGTPGMPPDPTMPPVVPPPDLQGLTTPFATQTGAGGLQGPALNDSFDGDFAGVFYAKTVVVGSHFVTKQVGTTVTVVPIFNAQGRIIGHRVITTPIFRNFFVTDTRVVHVPVPGRYSGITITDNDSPRPTDRLYFNYGYYDGLGSQINPGFGNVTQNRPMMGFEKTFLDGNASIGLRLPFIQMNGPIGTEGQTVGDLSILTKYAIINDRETGDVLSVGLVLTVPTAAADGTLADGTPVPHSVLIQPWVGFVRLFDRAYLQGFSSVIAPTDRRDTVILSNSLGMGYWLYRAPTDRILTGIIPIAEVHVRTPLNNRDPNGQVYMPDMVNITGGMHFRFPRATLGGAICVPVVSPRPWNVEAIAQFTFWF